MAKNKRQAKKVTPVANNKNTTVATHQSLEYSGPIPPASELAKYNNIIPDAAERILAMAEKDQQHAIDISNKALDATKDEAKLGQIFAFIITVSAFATSIAALVMGYPTVAGVIGGTTVVSLAIAFIKGREAK